MDSTAWLIVGTCIAIETTEQSLYRMASSALRRSAWLKWVALAVILHAIGLALWMLLLKRMPLGVVLPLMGANFVMILLAGRVLFKEMITPRRWIGVALVVAGFALVAMDQT